LIMTIERWAVTEKAGRGTPGNHVLVVANFGPNGHPGFPVTFPSTGVWHVRFNADAMPVYGTTFGDWKCGPHYDVRTGTEHIPVGPYSMVILSQDSRD